MKLNLSQLREPSIKVFCHSFSIVSRNFYPTIQKAKNFSPEKQKIYQILYHKASVGNKYKLKCLVLNI